MSSGMPELGSKISLISKADIRYEGELYTVDPVECTIALSNVRSFGTEEREAQCPVPAQAQIYDFILFRGSDIKDIRVVQGQQMPPNDPAIVQHQISHPPPSAAPGYPGVVQPAHTHTFSHHLGGAAPGSHLMGNSMATSHHVHPSAGGYNPMSGMTFTREPHKPVGTASHVIVGAGHPAGVVGGHASEPPPQQQRTSQNVNPLPPPNNSSNSDLIGSLSRSSTPAPRKSPSLDHQGSSGMLGGGTVGPRLGGGLGMGQRAVQRPASRQSRSRERMYNNHHSSNNHQSSEAGGPHASSSSQQPALTYRDRNDFYDRHEMRHEYRNDYRSGGEHHRRGDDRGNKAYVYNNYRHQDGGRMSRGGVGGGGGGGWNSHHNRQRSNSGGRRPRPRSRGPGGYPGRGGKAGNTLKFESDYDFDKANSEFNEMLNKLDNTKLDDGGAPVVVNGTGAPPGAPGAAAGSGPEDNGHELGEGGENEDDKFYDKTKSFFDNISCEAVERSKGAFQRTDWRQERKMNSETFGVAATRRGGGYRGRGGFYYGGGGRGYHHRNHYGNQGRSNRGGYGPRLGGGNSQAPRGSQQSGAQGNKETGSGTAGAAPSGGTTMKTAAQVVAGAPAPVATEAK